MNPLEDAIVALRPVSQDLPWPLPDSIRPLNPAMPLHSTLGFSHVNALGQPVAATNELTDFGWEYVWHCHLLSHEEMDMVRPIVFQVPSVTPTGPAELAADAFSARARRPVLDRSVEQRDRLQDRAATGGGTFVASAMDRSAEPDGLGAEAMPPPSSSFRAAPRHTRDAMGWALPHQAGAPSPDRRLRPPETPEGEFWRKLQWPHDT